MSWHWQSGIWWATRLPFVCVCFALQGHWLQTPAGGPVPSASIKSHSHVWPKFAYAWMCVCVCLTNGALPHFTNRTFGTVVVHTHYTEADSCHLRQMSQSDGMAVHACPFAFWQIHRGTTLCDCVPGWYWHYTSRSGVSQIISTRM